MANDEEYQTVSPLNRINLLSVCSKFNRNLDHLDLMLKQRSGYMIDSSGRNPTNYLDQHTTSNVAAFRKLFTLFSKDCCHYLDFDKDLLKHAFKMDKQWIVEECEALVFQQPLLYCDHGLKKLPIQGTIKYHKDKVLFLACSQYISYDLIENFVDFSESEEPQAINVTVSKMSLNLTKGSQESIEFLRAVKTFNNEVFYTKCANFIEVKWTRDKWILQLIAVYNVIYVIIIDYHGFHVKFHKWGPAEQFFTAMIFLMTLFLWYFEYKQVRSRSLLAYCCNITNWMDLSGQSCLIWYCLLMFSQAGKDYER